MPSALDKWTPANRAACFRQFAADLVEESKRVFARDGSHAQMWFFIGVDGQGFLVPTPPRTDRDEVLDEVKRTIRQHDTYGLVHIAESWAYLRRQPGDHTFRQVAEGEIAVSELRPEDKDEALVVMMSSREGEQFIWLTPILRDGGRVTLGETMGFPEPPGGRFAGLFDGE